MSDSDPRSEKPDLSTLLDDVKTIKSILQNTDAPLPPVWWILYYVACPAFLVIGLLKFFVPALAAMGFLDTLLWLWTPAMALVGIAGVTLMSHALKKSGTRFLAQGRVQAFLYTRLVLAPAVITLAYLLSLNPALSMEGCLCILLAVGMTQLVVLMPRHFRVLPLAFLVLGWAELAFGFRGAEWTLANTLLVAGAFAWIASLLQRNFQEEARRG